MNVNMTSQIVAGALIMAIWHRSKPKNLLHHPDQGSQYTSGQFQRLMADHGITCSMSRSGNVWERAFEGAIGSSPKASAAMESFFSSLKTERTIRIVYRSRDDAMAEVFDYIERFYNPRRRQSTLGCLSPMDFENKVGLA